MAIIIATVGGLELLAGERRNAKRAPSSSALRNSLSFNPTLIFERHPSATAVQHFFIRSQLRECILESYDLNPCGLPHLQPPSLSSATRSRTTMPPCFNVPFFFSQPSHREVAGSTVVLPSITGKRCTSTVLSPHPPYSNIPAPKLRNADPLCAANATHCCCKSCRANLTAARSRLRQLAAHSRPLT